MKTFRLLKNFYPLAVFLVLVLILFWPVLFSTKLFPGFDPLLVFYPYSFHYLSHQSFWASGILSGFGIWASPSSWAGNWLYYFLGIKFLDFVTFYNTIIIFYLILTIFFSYLASRKLGFDTLVSVLITSTYVFSAYSLSWMVNIVTAPALFIFPALIYFLLKFEASLNWFWPILGGLVLGFGFLMSHPQFALIAVLGGFIFSIFLVLGKDSKKPQLRFLGAFLVICFLGLAISAFQLWPEYQLSRLSQRGDAISFSESQECALGPFDFIRFILPNFIFFVSCESLLYVGALPLVLALFAVFYFREYRRQILFWTFLWLGTLLFSIKYSPLAWLFHQLPVWASLRGPGRILMLGNFALAVLAGFGFNFVLENKEKIKSLKLFFWFKRFFYIFLILAGVINVLSFFKERLISLFERLFDKYYYVKTIGLPLEHYHQAIRDLVSSNFYSFSFLNRGFVIPFFILVATFLVLILITRFSKISLFYFFLLSGFVWAFFSPMVSSGLSRDFFKSPQTAEFLKTQPGIENFRIYSLMPNLAVYQLLVLSFSGVSEGDQNEFLKELIPTNLNLLYGLDSIDGYDVSMPKRTSMVLAELLSERATLGNKIAQARLKPEEKIRIFEKRQNLLSMMNVKYIISAWALDESIFKKVFEVQTTRFKIPIYIYENPGAQERFYFASEVEFLRDDVFDKIINGNLNFQEKTLIECGVLQCWPNEFQPWRIIKSERGNGFLKLETINSGGDWLVFSETKAPLWEAKINGEVTPIYTANFIYQAVRVPPGKNLIEFKYLQ